MRILCIYHWEEVYRTVHKGLVNLSVLSDFNSPNNLPFDSFSLTLSCTYIHIHFLLSPLTMMQVEWWWTTSPLLKTSSYVHCRLNLDNTFYINFVNPNFLVLLLYNSKICSLSYCFTIVKCMLIAWRALLEIFLLCISEIAIK